MPLFNSKKKIARVVYEPYTTRSRAGVKYTHYRAMIVGGESGRGMNRVQRRRAWYSLPKIERMRLTEQYQR